MQTCSDQFTAEEKARNFDYYEQITVRDSSLAACTEAVMAAEVGHLRLALDYVAESALLDLHDYEKNTRDGLHMAALAGTWISLVAGLGGMRDDTETLQFAPRLPDGLTRLSFSIRYRNVCLHVEATAAEASYSLVHGAGSLELVHHGTPLTVTARETITRPIPPARERKPPTQPPGREPQRRSPG
jgi:alpha,alpha-trehalose phosphorylase